MIKRGEITSSTIGKYLLLLGGFVILIIFLFKVLDLEGIEEDEICRASVLARATAPEEAQRLIPLKCTTKKLCLSEGGEGCGEFIGEKNVENLKLPRGVVDKKSMIEKTSAEAMYDCWSMMGGGKLDLFGGLAIKLGLKPQHPTCVICHRIAYNIEDENTKEHLFGEGGAHRIDLENYLENTQVPGSRLTFLQEFTDSSVNSFAKVDNTPAKTPEEIDKLEAGIKKIETDTEELAVIFTQIQPESYEGTLETLANYGGIAAVTGFATPGIGTVALKLAGPYTLLIGLVSVAGVTTYSMLNVYEGRVAAAGYCGQFTSTEDALKGCSTVQIVPYEFSVIEKMCDGGIQGNP